MKVDLLPVAAVAMAVGKSLALPGAAPFSDTEETTPQLLIPALTVIAHSQIIQLPSHTRTTHQDEATTVNLEGDHEGHATIAPLLPKISNTISVLGDVPVKTYTSTEIIRETSAWLNKHNYRHKIGPRPTGLSSVTDVGGVRPFAKGKLRDLSSTPWSHLDLFAPISTKVPPPRFPVMDNHVCPTTHVSKGDSNTIHTNKFYTNLLTLDDREKPVFAMPYNVAWTDGTRHGLWGLAVDTIDVNKRTFGPRNGPGGAAEYYQNAFNPSLVLSAVQFKRGVSNIRLFDPAGQSARIRFYADEERYNRDSPDGEDSTKVMDAPICKGMGFVSVEYRGLTLVIGSIVAFEDIRQLPFDDGLVTKYLIRFVGGADSWLVYARHRSINEAKSAPFRLQIVGTTRLEAGHPFTGLLQVAHLSYDNLGNPTRETLLDRTTGSYCTGVEIGAQVTGPSGDQGEYQMRFKRAGPGKSPLLMYALPHHVKTFHNSTMANIKPIFKLPSPANGQMYGVITDTWRMKVESLPVEYGWLPLGEKGCVSFPPEVLQKISAISRVEIAQDLKGQTEVNPSMYFAGKLYAKYAFICYTTLRILKDPDLAQFCLSELKRSFKVFAENRQAKKMVYDVSWGGITSIQGFDEDPGEDNDFGNYLYSDHHFHYSYHLQTAALIVQLDKDLGNDNEWHRKHGEWANSLLRDYANPSPEDPYFPVFRNFDWYHGHSWARGIISSADSKDEESSSEDYNSLYAQKLWGLAIEDKPMVARANLMLGVMKVSLNEYMLMSPGNKNHPEEFTGNLVTGILSEGKCDHKTYFGTFPEYIQGIHMVPVTGMSRYIRSPEFSKLEYETYFSKMLHLGDSGADASWGGVIEANRAIFDPIGSWEFFNQDGFKDAWIDGGTSRTWSMVLSAGFGGLNAMDTCDIV